MHRRSKALYGISAAVLGLALTACGGEGSGAKSGASGIANGTVNGNAAGSGNGSGNAGAAPASSAPAKAQWAPALALGQPAPQSYATLAGGSGKFQVAATKIVKGTPKMLKDRHFEEQLGDTPYFVYVTYTLKEGKPDSSNPDLNAHAAVFDESGEEVAKRPVVHGGHLEGGCPVGDVYLGWDIGESRTYCSLWIGHSSKQPTRLAWAPDGETAEEYKKAGVSWKWATVPVSR
ncbi:hypothetical protein [Streptomyces sp. NBC_00091]|uniref:hypothetical protein n=1 Tax=Streptomyces sp. NBC_00091 TaxID=2975648 RepID=UPI00225C005C|nr:hypothetical protein [Streptomyces sp. NBC_00091]MCX5376251.1 hypothetical protein [Streptomyces sp. NBC_00091]